MAYRRPVIAAKERVYFNEIQQEINRLIAAPCAFAQFNERTEEIAFWRHEAIRMSQVIVRIERGE